MDDLPDITCNPPIPAEVGDQWICPECARKFTYIIITLEDWGFQSEAWFTREIGF